MNPIILISLDAVRPDHLSCYGYDKIKTENIDKIAEEGILFENCISSSCLTPVSMASVLTGNYPNKHCVRDPFDVVASKTMAEILKKKGYNTAGFVGITLLSKNLDFDKGFDIFKEPTKETSWHSFVYKKKSKEINTAWGYWWIDEFLDFIDKNYDKNFFLWGHYFETHVAAERYLLKSGLIKEGILSDWDYYDAKIKCADEYLIKPLIEKLKEKGIWKNITLIIMSDHGETFDEHKHPKKWCQHQTMYNTDLKNVLIIKDENLGIGKIKNKIRTIDIFPTILELFNEKIDCDGESLIPIIKGDKTNRTAYSEDLFEPRGYGAIQSIQDERYKLIRNITIKKEEFYNIEDDLDEKNNLIDKEDKNLIKKYRKILDEFLPEEKISIKALGY